MANTEEKKERSMTTGKTTEDNKPTRSTMTNRPTNLVDYVMSRFDPYWWDDITSMTRPGQWPTGWREKMYGGRMPRTNLMDMGDHFELKAELPGISKNNVDISLHENTLEIDAEDTGETEEEGKNYYYHEIGTTSFHREFKLPEDVKIDDVEATMNDGVLYVELPKVNPSPKKKGHQISIK